MHLHTTSVCRAHSWRARRQQRSSPRRPVSSQSTAVAKPAALQWGPPRPSAADLAKNNKASSAPTPVPAGEDEVLLSDGERTLLMPLHKIAHKKESAVFVLSCLEIVELEAARRRQQHGALERRPHEWDDLPEAEQKLSRRVYRDPEGALAALAPFIRGALGGAPATTHDAACRCLCALVDGTSAKEGGRLPPGCGALKLLNELQSSMHQGELAGLERIPALRGVLHDITPLGGGTTLLYALPALTRRGVAVLDTPPAVLSLLRRAYHEVMEGCCGEDSGERAGLMPDPTSSQRDGNRSPIYDGRAEKGAPVPVEWAALPERLHAEILEGMRPMCEQWCGHALTPVRFFGVRRYRHGAALESHVDSDPTVRAVGVSITVDVEGLEAPWLLQAAAAEGEPGAGAALPVGKCFVYEACRVRHYRPAPLRADVFANAFVHYTLAEWGGPTRPNA